MASRSNSSQCKYCHKELQSDSALKHHIAVTPRCKLSWEKDIMGELSNTKGNRKSTATYFDTDDSTFDHDALGKRQLFRCHEFMYFGCCATSNLVDVGQCCTWHERVPFFSNVNFNNLSTCLEYKWLVQHFHYLNKIYLGTILCPTSLHTSLNAAGPNHHGTIFDHSL